MKEYRVKLKNEFANALPVLIDRCIATDANCGWEDKMLVAAWVELKLKVQKRLVEVKKEYAFTFSAVHAIALMMIWEQLEYDEILNDYLENRLRQISNEVEQHYS
jgi:hypothetical protein